MQIYQVARCALFMMCQLNNFCKRFSQLEKLISILLKAYA